MDCSLPCSSIHGILQAKSTGVVCHFLLQRIFPTQGSNPGLRHCGQTLYRLSRQGSPFHTSGIIDSFSSDSGLFPLACFQCPSCCVCVCSVISSSLWPQGLQFTRLLCPWNSPSKTAGVCCHSLLQGIFLTQGLSPSLLHWQVHSVLFEPPGKPLWWVNSSQISVTRAKNTYSLLLLYICHCLPVAHCRGFNTVSSLMEKPLLGTLQL